MNSILTIKKTINNVRLFLVSDKEWKKPEKKKILIFDARASKPLLNYIDPAHASLLYHWREKANMYVLFRCILSRNLSWLEYIKQYINAVNPVVVITGADNSLTFYELKAVCQGVTTVSVQNTWRGEEDDIFLLLKKRTAPKNLCVDYLLTFNEEIGKLYQRYIEGKVISIGSLVNNHLPRTARVSQNTLVFISEFRRPLGKVDLIAKSGLPATWEDIYSLERILLPFLADYCETKGITLKICGAKPRDHEFEFDFYSSLLRRKQWQWIPRIDWYSNYSVMDSAEFVVFVNSTFGYESLGRGKKVAALSARNNWFQNSTSLKFGWPLGLPDTGLFWTNHADVLEFARVLDYVTSVSEADWMETWRQFGPRLMAYDPENSRLVLLLKRLDVPVKIDSQTVPVLKAVRG